MVKLFNHFWEKKFADLCKTCPVFNLFLVSWSIFIRMLRGGSEMSWGLLRSLVSWLTQGHMTRKQRWCGLSSVLRDPCLTRQTCNFIYPISGARIEAWVVMHTDKRTDSFIKEAFMLRVLEAPHSVPLAHPCADHKATVRLQRLESQKPLKGFDHIRSWKLYGVNVL